MTKFRAAQAIRVVRGQVHPGDGLPGEESCARIRVELTAHGSFLRGQGAFFFMMMFMQSRDPGEG